MQFFLNSLKAKLIWSVRSGGDSAPASRRDILPAYQRDAGPNPTSRSRQANILDDSKCDLPSRDLADEPADQTEFPGQDNLHSGNSTPASFSLFDISTLLPCDERDFAFGLVPTSRAALLGTPVAATHPELTSSPDRSLFATLVQAHQCWGQVARCACRSERDLAGDTAGPWEAESCYSHLVLALDVWEQQLPEKHKWSIRTLEGYRSESLDLVSATMPPAGGGVRG